MHRSIVWLQGIMKCEMVIEDQQQDEVSFSTEISQPTDPSVCVDTIFIIVDLRHSTWEM